MTSTAGERLGAPRSQPAALFTPVASHFRRIWVIKLRALPPTPPHTVLIVLANQLSSNSSGHTCMTVWSSAVDARDFDLRVVAGSSHVALNVVPNLAI
jgi:hypothetical protein